MRAWSVGRPDNKLSAYLEHVELHPDGISRRVLDERQPEFDLTASQAGAVECDETLYYLLDAPSYDIEATSHKSCTVLPLWNGGQPIGVIWLLFAGRLHGMSTEERNHLHLVGNMAGLVLGTVLETAGISRPQ